MADREFPLSIVIKALDRATAPLRALAGRLRAFRRAAGIDQLGKALKGVGEGFGRVFSEAGKLIAIGGGAGIALGALVSKGVEAGDALGNAAKRVGLSVTAYSSLAATAREAGIEQEKFTSAIDTFNVSLGQARAGKGKLAGFLGAVSPALLRQLKGAKDNAQGLQIAFRALDKVADPAKKAALAKSFFGASGPEMTQVLADGLDAFIARRKEIESLDDGGAERFVVGAKAVDDQLDNLTTTSIILGRSVLSELFPAFAVLVKQLTTFLVKNKDLIKLWSKKFGEQLLKFAQELPAHLQALGQKFDEIKQKLQPLADRVGGFTNLIGLLAGAIIAGPLLAAIASLAAAFVSLGIAIAATPIGWILLGIGALAAAAALFVKDWAPIKEFFSDLWQDVRDVFSGFVDFVAGAFTLDMKRALGGLGRIIKGALSIATAGFKAPFAVFKAVTNTPIDSLAEGIQGDAEAFAEENAPTLRGPQLPNIADEPTLQRRPVIGAAALRTQSAASTVVERSERTSKVKIEVAAPRGTKVKLPRESNPDVEYQVGYISELAR